MQPSLPVCRGSGGEVRQITIDEAIAAKQHSIALHPDRQIGGGVPGCQDKLYRAVSQVQRGVLGDRTVGVLQARPCVERGGFAAGPASWIRDEAVEFVDLGSKLVFGPAKLGVAINIDAAIAEVTVSADVIEMPLGVDHSQTVVGPRGRSVPVNSGSGQRARAGIDNQSSLAPCDEAGVDAPGRHITESRQRVAVWRYSHKCESDFQASIRCALLR